MPKRITVSIVSFVFIALCLLALPSFVRADDATATRAPSVDLQVTVSSFSGSCAINEHYGIAPASTETVYFCYRVTNNGDTTLTRHVVSDDQSGVVADFHQSLAPAATLFFTRSLSVSDDLVLTAKWESLNASSTVLVEDSDSAEIIVDAEQLTCNGGPVEFEGALHPSWNNANIPESPVFWLTTQFPTACSSANPENAAGGRGFAACADADLRNADPENYSANLRTTVDVSDYSHALLQFRWRHRQFTNSLFRVGAKPQNGSFQTIFLNTIGNPSGNQGDFRSINVSPLMAGATLEILFTYQGNTHDWYSHVDAVELICANTPLAITQLNASGSQAAAFAPHLTLLVISLVIATICVYKPKKL